MKKINFLTLALIITSILTFSSLHADEEETPKTSIQKIADLNMQIFGWGEDWWDTDNHIEFLKRHLEERLNPQPRRKQQTLFNLFEEIEKHHQSVKKTVFNDNDTWQDVNLFSGKTDKHKFIANALDRTKTGYGKISWYWLLAQPTTNRTMLEQRQEIIKLFLENKEVKNNISDALCKLKNSENALISFWDKDPMKRGLDRHLFSKGLLGGLNDNDTALFFKNIYDHSERFWWTTTTILAAGLLTSYGIVAATNIIDMPAQMEALANDYKGAGGPIFPLLWKINNRWVHALVALTSGIFCMSKIPDNIEWMRACFILEENLQILLGHVSQGIASLAKLQEVVAHYPELASYDEFKELSELFTTEIQNSTELQTFIELLDADAFHGEASMFSNKGVILRTYQIMHRVKTKFEAALGAAGRLDAYLSLAELYAENEHKKMRYSFATYVDAQAPMIKATNFWHPLVNPETVVANSLTLGTEQAHNNAIITGPNEGGKSTVLKALTVCLLLAQTVGIVPAESFTCTPFSSIATYLNITDDIGAGNSLFKAEVLRTQELLNTIENLGPNEFSFAVFDEVFNGTSPVEGEAAAYSVAKYLGGLKQNIALIATHFSLLTNLETETTSFTNYKVSINCHKNTDGKLVFDYPYKLEKGISNQHLALDILEHQGFSGTIIQDAQKVIANPRVK